MQNFFKVYKRWMCILNNFSGLVQHNQIKITLEEDYMLPILYSQYHACWCSGDFRSQGIGRHGIDPIAQNILPPASEDFNNIVQAAYGPSTLVTQNWTVSLQIWQWQCKIDLPLSTAKICFPSFSTAAGSLHWCARYWHPNAATSRASSSLEWSWAANKNGDTVRP